MPEDGGDSPHLYPVRGLRVVAAGYDLVEQVGEVCVVPEVSECIDDEQARVAVAGFERYPEDRRGTGTTRSQARYRTVTWVLGLCCTVDGRLEARFSERMDRARVRANLATTAAVG